MSERNLWAAVLMTYIEDAKRNLSLEEQRKLINKLTSDDTKTICGWIGIDCGSFKNKVLNEMAKSNSQKDKERPKHWWRRKDARK